MRAVRIIVVALVFLVAAVLLDPWGNTTPPSSVPDPSGAPSFEVLVVKPVSARPLMGLLPEGLEGVPPSALRVDHTSPGAEVRRVDARGLVVVAAGWELAIDVDGAGDLGADTELVFTLELGNRQRTLRGGPSTEGPREFETSDGAQPGTLDGRFRFEIATCVDAGTGDAVDWPQAPLTVRGSFAAQPRR